MRVVLTGCAGFIGSHLLSALLKRGDTVVGVDNLSTGLKENLRDVERDVGPEAWGRFSFVQDDAGNAMKVSDDSGVRLRPDIDVVYHLAALGSVPRSVELPLGTFRANVVPFGELLEDSRCASVKRFVYASSSSVYGASVSPEKRVGEEGVPLSPYAASKRMCEVLAESYRQAYGMECVGLRFFNVYGPRQRPDGPYAAVIPRWADAMRANEPVEIYGTGFQTRDFTYVDDVVAACLAAAGPLAENAPGVLNVGLGQPVALLKLFDCLKEITAYAAAPVHKSPRAGDVRSSYAENWPARTFLKWEPKYPLLAGLRAMLNVGADGYRWSRLETSRPVYGQDGAVIGRIEVGRE